MSRGQELFDQGEKYLKKWFVFGNKHEDAAELFNKAGNQFKVTKEWKSAGTAFMRCSDCHHHCGNTYESTEHIIEAARCFKKVRCEDAVLCYTTASEMLCNEGKFSQAGKLQRELGDFRAEAEEFDKAIESYKKAVDFFSGEEQHTSANSTLLEVAKTYAEKLNMPEEAIQAYETVAKSYLRHGSMKYQVKDILLKCMMCRFLQVTVQNKEVHLNTCKAAIRRYEDMDIHLGGTREAELMSAVIDAALEDDPKKIATAAAVYEGIKKLDDFQVQAVLYLKNVIEEDDEDYG
eukprot:TRINITY_DN19227_c0_g1_i1.p1 TRINITY_DN19227_c0_g1~~TRINITY_DN19227_c0_g1_i1.p1  ORF type:complete len:291 (+),score=157.94 TRINITY_DN19227_c0_g1_i1:72-944(+)